ncbi:hypothetical protein PFISCL1PPCAC_19084, partial [Pristionchus fissidentatus]
LRSSVFTTGFDNAKTNQGRCPSVHELQESEPFEFYINGPLATMFGHQDAEVELIVGSLLYYSLEYPSFFSSPGYIGCENGDVYRSSLYPKITKLYLTHQKKRSIHINAYLNTRDAVQLQVDWRK